MRRIALFILAAIGVSCSVDEAPELRRFMISDTEEKPIELKLTWTVNGQPDEGAIADVMLYLSESEDMSDAALSQSLGKQSLSRQDYYGNQRLVPTRRTDLFNAYRYYMGIAYHGLHNPAASVTYPMTIAYTVTLADQETGDVIETIDGSMVIDDPQENQTRIQYIYTMDFDDDGPEMTFRRYSFRKIETPFEVVRESDVERTNIFNPEVNLFIDMIWSVNGEVRGFEKLDLDMYLHDTNDRSVIEYTDLDDGSASEDTYEGFTVSPDETYFAANVPERLGFYVWEEEESLPSPSTVDYTFILYQYDGKLKKHVVSGSFNMPPISADNGLFYFCADIRKSDIQYTVTPISPRLEWAP